MNKMIPRMQARRQSAGTAQPNIGLRIVVIVLSILLAFNMGILLLRTGSSTYNYTYEYSEMDRTLTKGDLPALRNMVYENMARGSKTMEDTSEFEAIVREFEKEMRGN